MVELIWDGKYDADGKRVAPLRMELPFQTVETVNESAQQRQRMLNLFSAGARPRMAQPPYRATRNMCYLPCCLNSPEKWT